jgi:hypothetical protein
VYLAAMSAPHTAAKSSHMRTSHSLPRNCILSLTLLVRQEDVILDALFCLNADRLAYNLQFRLMNIPYWLGASLYVDSFERGNFSLSFTELNLILRLSTILDMFVGGKYEQDTKFEGQILTFERWWRGFPVLLRCLTRVYRCVRHFLAIFTDQLTLNL